MRRRWRILLLSACGVVAVVAVCFFCLRDDEPSYNGRTLSEWLRISSGYVSAQQRRTAQDAVLQIGTNAIPSLMQWCSEASIIRGEQIQKISNRLPRFIAGTKPVRSFVYEKTAKAAWANYGFAILGTNALQCLPELEQRFRATTNSVVIGVLVDVMQHLGKDAFDFFVDFARTSTDELQTRLAAHAIGTMAELMRTNGADSAVPVLLQIAQNRNDEARVRAITALGQLRLQPEIVVPFITRQVSITNGRFFAIWTLQAFGEQARSAIPTLKLALNDSDATVRFGATNALKSIAPQVLTNAASINN